MAGASDDSGQVLRNGKCKRTVDEPSANDQKRAALGDISNKALQRCEQVRARGRPRGVTRGGARGCASVLRARSPAPALAHTARISTPTRAPLIRARVASRSCTRPAARSRRSQGISKLGVQAGAPNVQTRAMRTRLAARQAAQLPADDPAAEPMSVEKKPAEIRDIDAYDTDDTQLCTAYVREIYDHLFELEQQNRVMTHYMNSQKDINATMRGILIDWLVEVAEEYRLVPETLYLAVNYIDRFLQQVPVNRGKLQLVGVTCMLIASYAPRARARARAPSISGARAHRCAAPGARCSLEQEVRGDPPARRR